ncbi:unnamed protein product [Psylliodes chrysocephalus]|uniref:Uncharacterized protein n=1 Tax=Psylliodes chrysocephalus TaxID=3402493 RepID=A0A9P0CYH2_9CUCU|nr:unnamed protein product [Psylliodes chrysocephala]
MAKCEEAGIACRQANEDADSLIVWTAESLAPTDQTVAIVREDVNLLVIMMDLNTSPNVYLLKPEKRKSASVTVPTTDCSKTKSCQAHDVSARDEWMRLDVIFI